MGVAFGHGSGANALLFCALISAACQRTQHESKDRHMPRQLPGLTLVSEFLIVLGIEVQRLPTSRIKVNAMLTYFAFGASHSFVLY